MKNKGFSLVEVLVVISLFAILGIVVSQSLLNTLSNTRKTESTIKVRESLNFFLSTAERRLRNALELNPSLCNSEYIPYLNENDQPAYFQCLGLSSQDTSRIIDETGEILIGEDIWVTNCSFQCTQTGSAPPKVVISVSAKAKDSSAEEASPITAQTVINLRVY